jgi:hypothetical protein
LFGSLVESDFSAAGLCGEDLEVRTVEVEAAEWEGATGTLEAAVRAVLPAWRPTGRTGCEFRASPEEREREALPTDRMDTRPRAVKAARAPA